MNILGIGGWEFVAILLIMLVVAGPKRMMRWAYILGTYMAKLRLMWAETMALVQKEFDQAGVDIQLPKEPPTRRSINEAAQKAFKPFTDPLQQTLAEVEADAQKVQQVAKLNIPNSKTSPETDQPANGDQGFGTWSNTDSKQD